MSINDLVSSNNIVSINLVTTEQGGLAVGFPHIPTAEDLKVIQPLIDSGQFEKAQSTGAGFYLARTGSLQPQAAGIELAADWKQKGYVIEGDF